MLIAVLAVSVSVQVIQTSLAAAMPSIASMELNCDEAGLVQHKITPSELETYKDAAGTSQENQTYQALGSFGTGLRAPSEEGWSAIEQNAYIVEQVNYQAALPAAVDLSASPYFPPIGDQGQQGSCASFALGYYCKTYQEAKEHNWDLSGAAWVGGADDCNITDPYKGKVMSPAFVYNLINGGQDVGSDFETPIRLLCEVGVSSWQNMPYYWQDYARWPSEAAWAEAPLYRSNSTYSYQYLYGNTTDGLESLKNWLAAGNLAVVAVDAYDNLWNYTTHSKALGSQDLMISDTYTVGPLDHAATVVGYDDLFTYIENGETRHGAIKIANTWGIDGSWENLPDGCYWISYAAFMKLSTPDNPVILFKNLDNYEPEITATFNLTHQTAGDCSVAFGLGTPAAPLAVKNFSAYITGGDRAFCSNNVVFDLTEFKNSLTGNFNQQFFMEVYDKGAASQGTADLGTVSYFAIADTASTQTPKATVDDVAVYVTLTHSFASSSLSVAPQSGFAGADLTLTGVGMAGDVVDISYFNPVTLQWVSVADGYAVSTNFTCPVCAPDLRQNSHAGDNPQSSDNIVFRVQDGGSQYEATYSEIRRGLTQICDRTSEGVFGNNTDLSTQVFVQSGQAMRVAGSGFKSGVADVFWDAENVGAAAVDVEGMFNASVTVPTATAGKHVLTVSDLNSNVSATVTRLPSVANNATAVWQTGDFTVNLTPDVQVTETYYKINNGQTQTVSVNGQPRISTEGDSNTVEYWSTWDVYGTGNMEVSRTVVSGLKLDKTAPSASVLINGYAKTTTTRSVTLTLNAQDETSGVKQVRFSNDDTFSQATWEPYSASKTWQLTSGAGTKTVYVQVQNNAGLTSTVSDAIDLKLPQTSTTSTPTSTVTPAPVVPEFTATIAILTLALLTVALLVTVKIRGKTSD